MKIYLAGQNGKKKILSLYESISRIGCNKDIEPKLLRYRQIDRQTDRQTDRADERIFSRRLERQPITIISEDSKQASKQASKRAARISRSRLS